MKQIYKQIWKLARPYYKKGRPMDIGHIEWMMKTTSSICKKENINESILIPLVILHDVGYAKVSKTNPFKSKLRKAHMKAGAKISQEILEKINYPKSKTKKIVYYISIHDNWALGNNIIYKKHKILGVFTDLDFIWMVTPKGFSAVKKILGKNKKQMIKYLKNNEKLIKRPFATKTTRRLFEEYLKKLKK